jgi:hypothetical protein
MKTNRRGFIKGSGLMAGLAALWAVDPSRILKEPDQEPEQEEVEIQEEEAKPEYYAGGASIRTYVGAEPIWIPTENGFEEIGKITTTGWNK